MDDVFSEEGLQKLKSQLEGDDAAEKDNGIRIINIMRQFMGENITDLVLKDISEDAVKDISETHKECSDFITIRNKDFDINNVYQVKIGKKAKMDQVLLSFALETGHVKLASFLLRKGAKLELDQPLKHEDEKGRLHNEYPLFFYIFKSFKYGMIDADQTKQLMRMFFDNGTPIRHQTVGSRDDNSGIICREPVFNRFILAGCDPNITEFMIREGKADINKHGEGTRVNPLIAAVTYPDQVANRRKNIDILIENGADLEARNFKGSTALHTAIAFECNALYHHLMSHKPNMNSQNNERQTPLMYSIMFADAEIALDLIEKGADLSLQDKHGKTALHYIEDKIEKMDKNDPQKLIWSRVEEVLLQKAWQTEKEERKQIISIDTPFGFPQNGPSTTTQEQHMPYIA